MSEIAERAGSTADYFWGDDTTKASEYVVAKRANATDASKIDQYLMPVGSKLPNSWGIYDVLGNCHEWCLDDGSRLNLADAPDPWTPADSEEGIAGNDRVMYSNYGRSNDNFRDAWRISNRVKSNGYAAPSESRDKKDWIYGFRVAYIVK
jgi:formylglycine-generating enzyme required for sulfatase activity